MSTGILSKARTRIAKKVVFLLVFTLVTLAYVTTPVLACNGNDGGNSFFNRAANLASNPPADSPSRPNPNPEALFLGHFFFGHTKGVVNSDEQTTTLLQQSSRSGTLELFQTNGSPLKLSSLQRAGQKFKVKIGRDLLNAVYLGNNQARVTLLDNKTVLIQLSPVQQKAIKAQQKAIKAQAKLGKAK